MSRKLHPFEFIRKRSYSRNRCFYCGCSLRGKYTNEHVFPRWLQKRFNLHNQSIHLLNGTTIRYSQITVPCCQPCNNVHLSKLERSVRDTLFHQRLSVARANADDVFMWACKILIGLVYLERLLPRDRTGKRAGRILPRAFWHAFQMTHFFIQGMRIPIDFTYGDAIRVPGSIFIFDLQCPAQTEAQFDFRDNLIGLSIYMRLGTRGIIVVIDGGALDISYGNLFRRDGRRKLHPLQFQELGAKAFYRATLLNRTPKYLLFEKAGRYQVMQMPLAGLSAKPIYEHWKQTDYAKALSIFTGFPLERLNPYSDDRVVTWLYDPTGKPAKMDLKKHPLYQSVDGAS